ncbi:unnamed protein product [Auanema sp. JU1783]|nr:unnamed protein product [Auanema sp. JU1783]
MIIIFFFFLLFVETCGESLSKGTLLSGGSSGTLQRIADAEDVASLSKQTHFVGVGETVNNLLERKGLQAEPQVVKLFSAVLESPVKPKTLRKVLRGMAGEFPNEQQEQYKGVVYKLNGLHKKREKLMKTLAHMLNYTEAQQQQMKSYLSNKKISEIMNEMESHVKTNATLNYKIQNLRRNMKGWGKVLKSEQT